ncbi:HNH endonuclease [Poseidonibacter lekithochrous]|uniref:HNH endonuclease n=1 Tax=Poseidonibacter TaxID=2321187 RepID=UPI001C0A2637|nr:MULTISPECIES: HNH endonuclease [Poseidonibacter]MBU3013933.1 HNH endonuclease [Poseidonibacter lekithochrous]MDO6827228.1 HNH endonuclease [Poseidonibacter sp. 1_MG-2023]
MSNIKENLLKNNNYKCFNCGCDVSFSNSSIDHIIPLSKGGTNNEDNLVLLCNKCNILKADKILNSMNMSPLTSSAVKL